MEIRTFGNGKKKKKKEKKRKEKKFPDCSLPNFWAGRIHHLQVGVVSIARGAYGFAHDNRDEYGGLPEDVSLRLETRNILCH
jgi:hypothetical protein